MSVCLSVCVSVPKRLMVDYAQTVQFFVFHRDINFVRDIMKLLGFKMYQNSIIGSTDKAILMTKNEFLHTYLD